MRSKNQLTKVRCFENVHIFSLVLKGTSFCHHAKGSIYCAIFMVGPNALIDLVTYPLQKVLNQLASAYITDQRFSVSRFDKILPFNQNSKLLDNILRVNYYWVNF